MTGSRQVVIEVERPRVVCGRREWFVVRLSFPSEHRAHIRARQLAREPEARTVRVVISEPDGHVSRYTYKSRFPRVRAFDIAS